MTAAEFDAEAIRIRPKLVDLAIRRLHNRDDAEDAVQQALMHGWLAVRDGKFEGRASLSTWLATIVWNEAAASYRRPRQKSRWDEEITARQKLVSKGRDK